MCHAHPTTLDLMRLRGEGPEPGEDGGQAAAEKIEIRSKVRAGLRCGRV